MHKRGGLKVTPLSDENKPDILIEKKRILSMNGRVCPILGHAGKWLGPNRVWLKFEDTPGLAMSRSIGDGLAH